MEIKPKIRSFLKTRGGVILILFVAFVGVATVATVVIYNVIPRPVVYPTPNLTDAPPTLRALLAGRIGTCESPSLTDGILAAFCQSTGISQDEWNSTSIDIAAHCIDVDEDGNLVGLASGGTAFRDVCDSCTVDSGFILRCQCGGSTKKGTDLDLKQVLGVTPPGLLTCYNYTSLPATT